MLTSRQTALLLIALLAASCAGDVCKDLPAAVELHLERGSAIGARSLMVSIIIGAERLRHVYELGAELEDGETSLVVRIDPPPTRDFDVSLNVEAFAEPAAKGQRLGLASESFRATPDGCNRFSLTLAAATDPDGGLSVVDGGQDGAMSSASDAGLDAETREGVDAEVARTDADVDAETMDVASSDAGLSDSGIEEDGGLADSGLADGGLADGGLADGGLADGGLADGGLADGGLADGGLADGGLADAVSADASLADSGVPDVGGADTGVVDAGSDAGAGIVFAYLPSNFDPLTLTPGPSVLLNCGATTLDTSNRTVTNPCGQTFTLVTRGQGAGPELLLLVTSRFELALGNSLRVVGSRPFAIVTSGDAIINGQLLGGAIAAIPGAGGSLSMPCTGSTGASGAGMMSGAGGGGGGYGGGGGPGGASASGDRGGVGGLEGGGIELIPLRGGCSGGSGGGMTGAAGGAGGGAVQVSAAGMLSIGGQILVGGGGGSGGSRRMGAGGAGSGGAILLEGEVVQLALTGALAANGGGAGEGGADGPSNPNGVSGQDGTLLFGLGGTSGSTGGDGGNGGGSQPNGLNGGTGSMGRAGGGGGGGGAGRIRINARVSCSLDGTVVPTATSNGAPSCP